MAVAMAVSPGTGPIVDTTAADGKYHMFNPLCEPALAPFAALSPFPKK